MEVESLATTLSSDAELYAFSSVIVASVFVLLPIRTCINCFANKDKALESEQEYNDLYMTFATDYDKENPLTGKQGQLRILEMQI